MTEELLKRIERNLGPRPLCRDCADFGPRCETGDLCDPVANRKEILEEIRESLASSTCSPKEDLRITESRKFAKDLLADLEVSAATIQGRTLEQFQRVLTAFNIANNEF